VQRAHYCLRIIFIVISILKILLIIIKHSAIKCLLGSRVFGQMN